MADAVLKNVSRNRPAHLCAGKATSYPPMHFKRSVMLLLSSTTYINVPQLRVFLPHFLLFLVFFLRYHVKSPVLPILAHS